VIAISKGEGALIFSCGFDVTDEPTGSAKPSIEILEVVLTAPGEGVFRQTVLAPRSSCRPQRANGLFAGCFQIDTVIDQDIS
jgi:hypothetical protein